jgi:hypothetical protein
MAMDWELRLITLYEFICKLLGNDLGIHQVVRGAGFVRITQLHDRLNGVELDQLSVFH